VLVLLLASGVLITHLIAPAEAASNGACGNTAVVAASAMVPVLDPQARAQTIAIPAGEPAIVATVNGDQITAVDLEVRVNIAFKSHQASLQQLPANAPASTRAELQKTPAQLRKEMLNQIIDARLLMQEAQHLGISVSQAEAQAEAQQQLQRFQSEPTSSPAHASFQAYLCVNHLDTSTFATNPLVLCGYHDALVQRAMIQHIIASLPASEQNNQDAIQQAIANYTQKLRQAASIQIFISLQ